jgi:hypothetical protein
MNVIEQRTPAAKLRGAGTRPGAAFTNFMNKSATDAVGS